MHHVQNLPADHSAELRQSVKALLKVNGIKRPPIIKQTAQPTAGHTLLPSRTQVRRQPGSRQSSRQILQRIPRQDRSLLVYLYEFVTHCA
jgi:hypothetical protein